MINAKIELGNDNRYYIKVHTSLPAAKTLIERIQGALYDPSRNLFAIPHHLYEYFVKTLEGFKIKWEKEDFIDYITEDNLPEQPLANNYSVTYGEDEVVIDSSGFKVKPYGMYQVKGFNAIYSNSFLILADDQGLGKTFQTLTALEAKVKDGQIKKGIILTKASLIYNWHREVEKYTNLRSIVYLGGRGKKDNLIGEMLLNNNWDVVIASYEAFSKDRNHFNLVDNYHKLDFMVLDEAHKIKNPLGKIGTSVHIISIPNIYVLTATPMPNNPLEAYNYLRLGKILHVNYYAFRNQFCIMGGFNNKQVVAYKNLPLLKSMLRESMLRRTKADKLKEIPPIITKDYYLELSESERKFYNSIKQEIKEELQGDNFKNISNPLTKLIRLQQCVNYAGLLGKEIISTKLNACIDLVNDIIENEEKVIIFSRFSSMVDILKNNFSNYNPAIIVGSLNVKERQSEVDRFQTDEECKVFIGTTGACREGITLTKATHVIFFDLEFSYAYIEQAFSRAHRIGQKNTVIVHNLIAQNTVDEHVKKIVQNKKILIDHLVEENNFNVMNDILTDALS